MILAAACADEQHPVLTGHGGPVLPGGASSGTSDAAAGTFPVSLGLDAMTDVLGTDAVLGPPCNLLAQDCIDPPGANHGCYPVDSKGMCAVAGSKSTGMTCRLDTDCDQGLVCVLPTNQGSGLCEPLCDLTKLGACTGRTQTCSVMAGFPEGIGACMPS